jgi:hypothetical protein
VPTQHYSARLECEATGPTLWAHSALVRQEAQRCGSATVVRCRWVGEQVKGADAEPTVKLRELLSRMDGSEPFDSMIYHKELQPSAWKSMAEYFEVGAPAFANRRPARRMCRSIRHCVPLHAKSGAGFCRRCQRYCRR